MSNAYKLDIVGTTLPLALRNIRSDSSSLMATEALVMGGDYPRAGTGLFTQASWEGGVEGSD
jgi:hypothetical protein